MEEFTVSRLSIEYVSIDLLKPFSRNARTHSRRQVQQIANSIQSFGWTNPILTDRSFRMVAGHGRYQAAKLLGIKEVPTIRIESLTEDQLRIYVLADNKLAENAGWDNSILAIEFQHLSNVDVDLTLSGFEIPEIDLILEEFAGDYDKEDEVSPRNPDQPQVTRLGDLWVLDCHRIFCGDALRANTYRSVLEDKRASVVFSDHPYNVPIHGHASGRGRVRHREFAMACGELTKEEYFSFLRDTISLAVQFSSERATGFYCMDWRSIDLLIRAAMETYDEYANLCVWAKDTPGLGSFYRSQHELIAVFRKGKGSPRNNIQLGRFGRNRTNLWQYPGINSLSKQSDEGNLLALHPTVKPTRLIADALLDASARGEIALDPFLGSGSTLVAATRTGRVCCGIEIDPVYVDIAVQRWKKYTGGEAIHAGTGKTFAAIESLRSKGNV